MTYTIINRCYYGTDSNAVGMDNPITHMGGSMERNSIMAFCQKQAPRMVYSIIYYEHCRITPYNILADKQEEIIV